MNIVDILIGRQVHLAESFACGGFIGCHDLLWKGLSSKLGESGSWLGEKSLGLWFSGVFVLCCSRICPFRYAQLTTY